MRLIEFDEFSRLSKFFYKTVGIRPYNDLNSKYSLYDYIIMLTGLTNLIVILSFEALFVVQAFLNGNNFVEAVLLLAYCGFDFVCVVKIFSAWWKKAELTNLVNDLKEIFPKSAKQQQKLQMHTYLHQCTILTISFSTLYMILIWTFNLITIVEYLIYNCWLQKRALGIELPYLMYIPWDYNDNWTFYMLYVAQDWAAYTSAAGQISSDLLLCAIITQVIMHYDNISRSIGLYRLKANHFMRSNEQHEKDLDFLKSIIAYHDKVLRLSDAMNNVFGVPLLINFFASCSVICFVGFQLAVGGADVETQFKLFLFLISSIAQVYLICYYGQLLMDASTNVASSVYAHNWSNADIRYKKSLILLMKRAQRPALLRATIFADVSLTTMADLMKVSYQFFTVLKTMYANKY